MDLARRVRYLVADTPPELIKRGWASDHEHPEPWNWDYVGLRWMQQYIRRNPLGRPRVVLDIGAGPRPYRALIDASDHYIGLDVYRSSGATLLGDGQRLPLRDNSVDLVVSFQVLEHVERPRQMVDEMARVLRPGGQLFISAPGAWPFHGHDYWRFTHEGLGILFQSFADLTITPLGGPIYLGAILAAYVARDMAARLHNKPARITGRLAVAGATVALNGALIGVERVLRRSASYEHLRYDCTDVYFVSGRKPPASTA